MDSSLHQESHTGVDRANHHLLTERMWRSVGEQLQLSPRELQIVKHIFDDHTDRRIGQALGISYHTVNTHLRRLYNKLNLSGRVALVVRICAEVQRIDNDPSNPYL